MSTYLISGRRFNETGEELAAFILHFKKSLFEFRQGEKIDFFMKNNACLGDFARGDLIEWWGQVDC
jgi:hypothetical protein